MHARADAQRHTPVLGLVRRSALGRGAGGFAVPLTVGGGRAGCVCGAPVKSLWAVYATPGAVGSVECLWAWLMDGECLPSAGSQAADSYVSQRGTNSVASRSWLLM